VRGVKQRLRTLGIVALVGVVGVLVFLALRPEPTPAPATGPPVNQDVVVDATGKSEQLTLAGGPALVLEPEDPTGQLVIYVHGAGEAETAIRTDPQKAPIIAALLEDGYTVAAASAGGDSWGTNAALDDYVRLQRRLAPADGTYLLVQSMGGLIGLRAPDVLDDVRAIAAIFPVCNLDSMVDGMFAPGIEEAHGADLDAAARALSPSVAGDVDGIAMRFWASPDDTFVPADSNAFSCADVAEERGAVVTVTETSGQHGDDSNFDAAAVLELFEAA
jgi:hypothetical protein